MRPAESRRLGAIWRIPFRPAMAKTCWKISKELRQRVNPALDRLDVQIGQVEVRHRIVDSRKLVAAGTAAESGRGDRSR